MTAAEDAVRESGVIIMLAKSNDGHGGEAFCHELMVEGDKADAAREAGADFVGDMDMVEKIQKENWFDFDVVVASPDMMDENG